MRFRVPLTIILIAVGLGCAVPQRAEQPASPRPAVSEESPHDSLIALHGSDQPVSLASGSVAQLRVAARRACRAVVDIHVVPAEGAEEPLLPDHAHAASGRSTGSGVIIDGSGYILTNEHVIRDAAEVIIALPDGRRVSAVEKAVHPTLDLAVLRIACEDLPSLTPTVGHPGRGRAVAALAGISFADESPIREGVVTHTHVSLQRALDPTRGRVYDDLIESTTKIEPGFSGGPLIDSKGQLVGINVAVSGAIGSTGSRGYAITMCSSTREAIRSLINGLRRRPAAHQASDRPPD